VHSLCHLLIVISLCRLLFIITGGLVLQLILSAECAEKKGDSYTPPPADEILQSLKDQHPRMILTPESKSEVKKLIEKNEMAGRIYESIKSAADKALTQPPSQYDLPDGRRLLSVSGTVLKRVENLAFVYHMTGDRRYVDRAWEELAAAAKFNDWNPSHFLDTAVMTRAFGIGYDWLWHEWTDEQRDILRQAIIEKGIAPFKELIAQGRRKSWWHTTTINWNQICNGGIGIGALAIAGEEPELAQEVLAMVLENIPNSLRSYAPDGASAEGAAYWSFAIHHGANFLACLETSLGTDFGLAEVDGYAESGYYHMYFSGYGRRAFEFGDCGSVECSIAQHFWMTRRFEIPHFAWYRHQALSEGQSGGIYDLFWFDDSVKASDLDDLSLDKRFRRIECASMRDSWESDDGFIIGLQGGRNDWTHRHYDLGSFILDYDGVRWIVDLGKEGQTYHLLKSKWKRQDYYRARAEAHNTLVINPGKGPGQDKEGSAVFTTFESTPNEAIATLDLTSAYGGQAEKIIRTYRLERGKRFTVTDEIVLKEPSELWSFLHTGAEVSLGTDNRSATLSKQGKRLRVQLVKPEDAVFTLMPSAPGKQSPDPPKQSPNKEKQQMVVRLNNVTSTRIEIRFEP
jgi:hypothetical protein